MVTHSSILSWRIPWTEEPGGLQSIGGHDGSDLAYPHHSCPEGQRDWFNCAAGGGRAGHKLRPSFPRCLTCPFSRPVRPP